MGRLGTSDDLTLHQQCICPSCGLARREVRSPALGELDHLLRAEVVEPVEPLASVPCQTVHCGFGGIAQALPAGTGRLAIRYSMERPTPLPRTSRPGLTASRSGVV